MKLTLKTPVKEWREREFPLIFKRDIDPMQFVDWKVIKAIPIVGFLI